MRHIILVLSFFLLFGTTARAQDSLENPYDQLPAVDPMAFVPADVAGVVHVRSTDINDLQALRRAVETGAALRRPVLSELTIQSYEVFFPTDLLDSEDLTFTTSVLPWLDGEFVVAYADIGPGLTVRSEDMLLLLPAANTLAASGAMSAIYGEQDLPEQVRYRDIPIYAGDRAAFAVLPGLVVFGEITMVESVIDIHQDESGSLTDDPTYRRFAQDAPSDALMSVFLADQTVIQYGVNYALAGGLEDALALYGAVSQTLNDYRGPGTLEAAVFGDGLTGLGGSITARTAETSSLQLLGSGVLPLTVEDGEPGRLDAVILLYQDPTEETPSSLVFDATVLDYLPRSAFLVHSGPDAAGFSENLLVFSPFANYFPDLFAGFGFSPSAERNQLLQAPNADAALAAIVSYEAVLEQLSGVNLQEDLIASLDGSYTVALLPRPNNPILSLSLPFDLLVVSSVSDADAAATGMETLLEALFGGQPFEDTQIGETSLRGIPSAFSDELAFGLLTTPDDVLVMGTGDAVAASLAAARGDNRLIEEARWQVLDDEAPPNLYVESATLLSTLGLTDGPLATDIGRLAVRGQQVREDTFQIQLTLTIPPAGNQ